MTKEELFKAIGDLEESLLDENVQQIEKKHHLHIFAAIAACAAVCIGAVGLSKLAASPQMPIGNPVPTEETTESTTESTTETMTEGTTEFEGFLDGVKYYPLPADASLDAVCTDWLVPELGGSAYFTLDEEQGLYQIIDPLSSAMPETGTFTREDDMITAVSYDGTQSHTLRVLDDYVMELTESTSWEHLTGRVFSMRIYAEMPLSEVMPEQISSIICNGWDISPDAEQMEELAEHLRQVIRYQELPDLPRHDGSRHIEFTLTENGSSSQICIANRYHENGTQYVLEQSSCDALYAFLAPFVEQARQDWEEDAKALPYQANVRYYLDGETESGVQIQLGQGNYHMQFGGGSEESGIYAIKDGVVCCDSGENEHRFTILDDYTFRLTETTHQEGGCAELLERDFTCRVHPEQPFGDGFSAEDVVRVHYFPKDKDLVFQLTPDTKVMEAFLACAAELVIYKEPVTLVTKETVDTSQMHHIIITLENSSMGLYIGDYVLLDDVGYVYDKSSVQALEGFAERMLAGEFTNEETLDVPIGDTGFTRPDFSMILPVPVTNELGGITQALVYGRSQGTFRHMEQLSGSVEICYSRNTPSITKGSFRFDFAHDLYSSTVDSYNNDAPIQKIRTYKTGPRTVRVSDDISGEYEDYIAITNHDLVMRENGSEDITLGQGADPTGVHELASCFFPYEISYGYLHEFSRWELCGTAQYQGRECVVIQGKGGDYGARFEVENYTLWVDLETGMWLFLEGYDANGEVCQYIYTKDIRLNADALPPEKLSDEEFERLCSERRVYDDAEMD